MNLMIDPEFESKIPPLTREEYAALEDNLLSEGRAINPIIVWNGTIVDGHNRYRIIQNNPHIKYSIYEKEFSDRHAAIAWICKNQLGRRNLTPEQKKYLIGKQYEAEKQTQKFRGNQHTSGSGQNEQNLTTGERIAKETNTSDSYVRRAERFARGVDLADEAIPGMKQNILSGHLKVTDAELQSLSKAAPADRAVLARQMAAPKSPAQKKRSTYKSEYYSPVQKIAENMLHAQGKATVQDGLYELTDAMDDMIFRWQRQMEIASNLLESEEYRTGTRQLLDTLAAFVAEMETHLEDAEK